MGGYLARVRIIPGFSPNSATFDKAFGQALRSARRSFLYGGTEFRIEFDDHGRVKSVGAELPLDAELPIVFSEGELSVHWVIVQCIVPNNLLAPPGFYNGRTYGLPDAACKVELNNNDHQGKSTIHAFGKDFPNVTRLFGHVMRGELTPSKPART
jgi:hypothetical protein